MEMEDQLEGKWCTNHGKCIRESPVSGYKCDCYNQTEGKSDFMGKDCKDYNYCHFKHNVPNWPTPGDTNGDEVCAKAHSTPKAECDTAALGDLGFRCKCPNDKPNEKDRTIWNHKQLR
jgi:hypothetical protein